MSLCTHHCCHRQRRKTDKNKRTHTSNFHDVMNKICQKYPFRMTQFPIHHKFIATMMLLAGYQRISTRDSQMEFPLFVILVFRSRGWNFRLAGTVPTANPFIDGFLIESDWKFFFQPMRKSFENAPQVEWCFLPFGMQSASLQSSVAWWREWDEPPACKHPSYEMFSTWTQIRFVIFLTKKHLLRNLYENSISSSIKR